MTEPDLSRYRVGPDATIEDIDLDEVVVTRADGTRLTEAVAEQIVHEFLTARDHADTAPAGAYRVVVSLNDDDTWHVVVLGVGPVVDVRGEGNVEGSARALINLATGATDFDVELVGGLLALPEAEQAGYYGRTHDLTGFNVSEPVHVRRPDSND